MAFLKQILVNWLVSFILLQLLKESQSLTLDEELTLTYDQKIKLDKLKSIALKRLPQDFMKEDLYLVRFLRVNDFNVPAAERMLMENVKWREDNNIDNILEEDWSDMDSEYKISVEGCDTEGRPVLSTIVGEWDMRKAVVTGKTKRMMRYTDKLMEEGRLLVEMLQKAGHNVTQFVELFDMSNFNLATHGCPQCLAIYAYNFQSYEKHFPLAIHKAITINTPSFFSNVYQILSPLLSKQTRSIVSFYGRDKDEWQPVLKRLIGEKNLSKQFGGKKEEAWDVEDLRRDHSVYKCETTVDSSSS